MAGGTVIDQLIVKLGLDPKDFTKGEKEIASGVLRMKDGVRKGAADMAGSMKQAAGSLAQSGGVIGRVFSKGGIVGLAIAATVGGLKLANDALYKVAESTRKLGKDAKNFDTAAGSLRNMENAAELAGGALGDASQTAGGLAKSLFDLRFNGQISDSLIMLGRLGVRFQDATGKARDFKSVTLDLADALERNQKQGTMSAGEALFAAQQAGYTGGMAHLVTQGRAGVEAELAKQESRRQVSGGDVNAASKWVRSSLSKGQAFEAEVGVAAMSKAADVNAAANAKIEHGITSGARGFGEIVGKASDALDDLAQSARDAAQSVTQTFSSRQNFRGAIYSMDFNRAAKRHGVRADVLKGIARTESGFDAGATARNEAGEITGKGIMQLNPKFFPNAGKETGADINTAAKHLRDLLDSFEGTEQEKYIHALRSYHAGETNYRKGTNLGPVNEAYAGKVLSGSALDLRGGNTTVNINKVDVVTQSRDADGIARDFSGAVNRKMNAAQADRGMN